MSNMPLDYIEKSINCKECNEKMANISIEPDIIEIEMKCSKEHKHKIKINKKNWAIETLIKKEE